MLTRDLLRNGKKTLLALFAGFLTGILAPLCFAQRPEPVLQVGHAFDFYAGSRVTAIAFTPDNRFVLTGGKEGSVKVWERNSGLLVKTVPIYLETVTALTISPDGLTFLTGSSDNQIDLWELSSGQHVRSFQNQTKNASVNDLEFSPDGQIFVSHTIHLAATQGPLVDLKLWKTNSGALFQVLDIQNEPGKPFYVSNVEFNPSGETIAADSVASILIWSASSGKILKRIETAKNVRLLGYSPDGRRLAVAERDGEQITILNPQNSQTIRSISLDGDARQIALSPNWKYFATSGQTVKLWEFEAGEVIRRQNYEGDEIPELAFSTDGLALGMVYGSSFKLLSTREGTNVLAFGQALDFTTGAAFSMDGKSLAWSSKEIIYVWDLARGKLLHILRGHTSNVNEVAFSPDGNALASCSDAEVKIWSLGSGGLIRNLALAKDYDEYTWHQTIAYSPDGRFLASGYRFGVDDGSETLGIKLWDARSGRLLKTLRIPPKRTLARIPFVSFFVPGGPTAEVRSIAFSPSGKLLASGDGYGVVRIWDVRRGKLVRSLEEHTDSVNSVAFSRDSKRVVSGAFDNSVKIWDARTGRRIHNLLSHKHQVTSVEFSNDGKSVISGSYDHTVKVWDSDTGVLKSTLQDHTAIVTSVAVSPKEPIFVSTSLDGNVNLWSLNRSQLLATLVVTPDETSVSFSPEGYYASSKGGDAYLAWRVGNSMYSMSDEYRARYFKPAVMLEKIHDKDVPVASSAPVSPSTGNIAQPDRVLVHPESIKLVSSLPPRSKRWALIIGIDEYDDQNITPLRSATNDANALASVLKENAGFNENQIILLTNTQPPSKHPTRVNILKYLSNLKGLVPQDGLLFVSFSGHGIERKGQAFLIPSDAVYTEDIKLLQNTAINVEAIKEDIKETGVGQVLILLDACRNDPVSGRAESMNALTETYLRAFNFDVRNREVEAFAVIYATKVGQRAYEYADKRLGYFTWAVVEAMKGGAANSQGEVTLSSLINYVQDIVPSRIAIDLGQGKKQFPYPIVEGYRADALVVAVAKK